MALVSLLLSWGDSFSRTVTAKGSVVHPSDNTRVSKEQRLTGNHRAIPNDSAKPAKALFFPSQIPHGLSWM